MLVDENGAVCTAAVVGADCRDKVSWQTREMAGRAGVNDMGIRKTFARDASAGDRDRIVGCMMGWMRCGRRRRRMELTIREDQ